MRTVLVTGAARGIGRAIALALAGDGWKIHAGVRREADAESLAREARGRVVPVSLDVADRANVESLAEAPGIVVDGPLKALYERHIAGMRRLVPWMQKTAVPVDRVVATVQQALSDRRPRVRYPVGAATRARAAMPVAMRDALLARAAGIPRRAR